MKSDAKRMNNDLQLLGKEFWGALHFEANLVGLSTYLESSKYGIDLLQFTQWLLFPELIPPNIRPSIHSLMRERINLPLSRNYYHSIKDSEMTKDERIVHEQACELLHFKYSHTFASRERFKYLYQLTEEEFRIFTDKLMTFGYASIDDMFEYYAYYKAVHHD